jgi:hypothetical protein
MKRSIRIATEQIAGDTRTAPDGEYDVQIEDNDEYVCSVRVLGDSPEDAERRVVRWLAGLVRAGMRKR